MAMPLTALQNGETGIIASTDFSPEKQACKRRAQKIGKLHLTTERCLKRLADLGLTPGTKITVVKSAPFHGPLEINVRGSRLAIGRGMASRIMVDVER